MTPSFQQKRCHRRIQRVSCLGVAVLIACESGVFSSDGLGFFDFLNSVTEKAKPEEIVRKSDLVDKDGNKVLLATYQQVKIIDRLRRSSKGIAEQWNDYLNETGSNLTKKSPIAKMPEEFVQDFIDTPTSYPAQLQKEFLKTVNLTAVTVSASFEAEEKRGEKRSKLLGKSSMNMVKSDKWFAEERRGLARQIIELKQKDAEGLGQWQAWVDALENGDDDADDEDSKMIRAEMFMRSTTGRKKTALESWYDAQNGRVPGESENDYGGFERQDELGRIK